VGLAYKSLMGLGRIALEPIDQPGLGGAEGEPIAPWGFVFGSSHDIRCTFSPVSGRPERYTGSISQFGVDIGYQQSAVIIWGVLAPTTTPGPGALAGTYVGATASAAVGAGLGANVLVGGSNKSISLQPVSLEGGVGLNVAGGIAALTLTYQP